MNGQEFYLENIQTANRRIHVWTNVVQIQQNVVARTVESLTAIAAGHVCASAVKYIGIQ
ncbi:hypothetical protein [Sterolibacterium denitrificans]|uniref:hypothetical protein n=1 Tax=Sterolibacterium denitrificans TaxID=157592 RepID=UPI0015628321|nr:hypothetical protein [Sterolibacterium denitrificans]